MLFVISILYKMGTLTQMEEMQRMMSPEQKSDFLLPYVSLSGIMLALCISGIVAFGLIVLVLLADDVLKAQRKLLWLETHAV